MPMDLFCERTLEPAGGRWFLDRRRGYLEKVIHDTYWWPAETRFVTREEIAETERRCAPRESRAPCAAA